MTRLQYLKDKHLLEALLFNYHNAIFILHKKGVTVSSENMKHLPSNLFAGVRLIKISVKLLL